MKNGPDLWRAILEPIRAVYGADAVIAGGCVRDYLLGFEPTDIDVFVSTPYAAQIERFGEELPRASFITDREVIDPHKYGRSDDFNRHLVGVLETTFVDPDFNRWAVQIIGRHQLSLGVTALIESFDSHIVRCWFDGITTHSTELATRDRRKRTVTLARAETAGAVECSEDRAARFISRHPEFRFVDPRPAVPITWAQQ